MVSRPEDGAEGNRLRIDKWLWQARFFKTRAIAADLVSAGRVRRNGARMTKPGTQVAPGDTLTFPQGSRIRVVRVIATGIRRGPPVEAQALYDDLASTEGTPPPLE